MSNRRESTSSDLSSTTTLYTDKQPSLTSIKALAEEDVNTTSATASLPPKKRGFRQKAKDVMHDFGAPPTKRQDKKDGKETKNYLEPGLIGSQGANGAI